MDVLPREIICLIMDHLTPWESLQLRLLSKTLCDFVTYNQSYWYRHFCWYLIGQKKKPALHKTGCSRVHLGEMNATCLSLDDQIQLAKLGNCSTINLQSYIDINPGCLQQYVCSNVAHYSYTIPKSLSEIPLDQNDYKPHDQVYINRFLIHNYRSQRSRASRYNKTEIKHQIKQTQSEIITKRKELAKIISNMTRDIKKLEARGQFLGDLHSQLVLLEKNKVFLNQRSRTYRNKFL